MTCETTTMRVRYIGRLLLAVCLLSTVAQSQSQTNLDKNDVVSRAKRNYYLLTDQGMIGFRCTVELNWTKFAADNFPNRPNAMPLNLLNQVAFAVSVGPDGEAKVETFVRDGGTIDKSIQATIDSGREMVVGFFGAWSPLVVNSVFPGSQDSFTMKEESGNYRISSPDGGEILMSKDFLITEMVAPIPGSRIVMRPAYTKIDKGLLLTTLDSVINDSMKVYLSIQYQDSDGLRLPSKATYRVTDSRSSVIIEISFFGYQTSKK